MAATKTAAIEIPRLDIQFKEIILVGDSPLVVHRWADKARKQMLDKQMKKAKPGKKEAKDPERDYIESLYWYSEKPTDPTLKDVEKGEFGFPAIGFKAAAVAACSQIDGMTKVMARGAFHIDADLVRIDGRPSPREDMVRVGMGTADIRYRAEFKEWRAQLGIRYNAGVLSLEQIVNLFNVAGFAVGVGEHRPQKNGSWGMFHVATQEEVQS